MLQKKFFCTVFVTVYCIANLVIWSNFIVSNLQFFYIIFKQYFHRSHVQNFKFLPLSFFKKIFLYRFFYIFLHLVQTSFIGSHVQFIYIGLPQFLIRHTCYSLRFSLLILQKKFFVQFCYSFTVSQIQLFSPILYFHTCNSFISLFYYNVYPSNGQFLRFLLFVFFIEINSH